MTVQRTGGTTLTDSLGVAFPGHQVLHEPLLAKRPWARIMERFVVGKPTDRIHGELSTELRADLIIKHCCELVPQTLNHILIDAARANGFRFILLYRENELDRLRSKLFSRRTGIYHLDKLAEVNPSPPELVSLMLETDQETIDGEITRSEAAGAALVDVANSLRMRGQPFYAVRYEDLYKDRQAGMANFERILEYFGADMVAWQTARQSVLDLLETTELGTKEYYDYLPFEGLDKESINERWTALRALMRIDPPGVVKPASLLERALAAVRGRAGP
jgi:hypothetical protein